MTDGFGNPKFIFNPHTYGELRAKLDGKVDKYLECISMRGQLGATVDSVENARILLDDDAEASCEKIRPLVPALDAQQVSPIAVLERCKSNYQQKQWDVGSFMLYDRKRSAEALSTTSTLPGMGASDPVGTCLLRAEKNRESNLACMSDYLRDTYAGESSGTVFWRYEKTHFVLPSSLSTSSDNTDACIVFSGPAKKNDSSATTLEFKKCSHDYTDTGCIIPHMVWSSGSKNKVGVHLCHSSTLLSDSLT